MMAKESENAGIRVDLESSKNSFRTSKSKDRNVEGFLSNFANARLPAFICH